MKYSLIMTVYKNDKPGWFKQAIESMLLQTLVPDEVILVEDGPISDELEKEIQNSLINNRFKVKTRIEKFETNKGAGPARQKGVELAKNEYLAFLDSDDISLKDRIEKQLHIMNSKNVDFVGTNVFEFYKDLEGIVSEVIMPEMNDDVIKFAKKRCPARQSGSFAKKSVIINAGGYLDSPLTEDWHLYVRMLQNGSKFYNIQECLTYVRVGDDFYSRRGGINYLKKIINFKKWMLNIGFINKFEFLKTSIPSIFVSIMPNKFRNYFYRTFLRK